MIKIWSKPTKKEYGEICTDEDAKQAFFTEAYLYNLLGKEDARTLLALMKEALKSVGVDLNERIN